MKKIILTSRYESPCGTLIIGSIGNELCLCDWQRRRNRTQIDSRLAKVLNAQYEEGESPIIEETQKQLNEYFRKERKIFDLPLLLAGTDFQKKVWQTLTEIPYGTTLSYKEEAFKMNMEKGIRAVALANGANAISIIIPCHRVIGSNHSLTGYAGGLDAKQYLLQLEGVIPEPQNAF